MLFNRYLLEGGGGGGALSCFYKFGLTVPCLMDHDMTDIHTDFLLLQLIQST